MNAKYFYEAIKKKFSISSDVELSKALGIACATISRWKNNGAKVTPSQAANLILNAKKKGMYEAHHYSIKPIVEYFPIEHEWSRDGAKYEVFDSKNPKNTRLKEVKEALIDAIGVYVFYDSQCKALYVGKAKEQSLWAEMHDAFNRDRETQRIRLVEHPTVNRKFVPAYKKVRSIRLTHVQLCDMAYYFSAYRVDYDMINNVEALLVRVFANGLLNAQMESFSK